MIKINNNNKCVICIIYDHAHKEACSWWETVTEYERQKKRQLYRQVIEDIKNSWETNNKILYIMKYT